jgi:hypothetical protein
MHGGRYSRIFAIPNGCLRDFGDARANGRGGDQIQHVYMIVCAAEWLVRKGCDR